MNNLKEIEAAVFPSTENTIEVEDDEIYGGCHSYVIRKCLGFNNGNTDYCNNDVRIDFIKKEDDGRIISGLQSEQLAYVLLDRCKKLNTRFPSDHNTKQIAGLEMFLQGCRDRVEERIERGVMGELKK